MWRQRRHDWSDLSQCAVAWRQYVSDVSPHCQGAVDVHTKVSGWLHRMNLVLADLYVSIVNVMATACRSAPDELCLLFVQQQPVAARPPRNVVDALRHVGLERAGIGRWGPAINLGVVRVQVGRQTVVGNQRHEVGDIQDAINSSRWLLKTVINCCFICTCVSDALCQCQCQSWIYIQL